MKAKKTTETLELLAVMRELNTPVREIADFIIEASTSQDPAKKKMTDFIFGTKKKKKNKETGELEDTNNLNFTRGVCNNISAALFHPEDTKNAAVASADFTPALAKAGLLPLTFDTAYSFDASSTSRWKDAALYSALCRVGSWMSCNQRTKANFAEKQD